MGFSDVRITAPYAATFPTVGDLVTGTENPLYGLVTFLHDSVPKSSRYTLDGVTYTWNANLLLEMLTIPLMTAVGASGAEFYDVPLYFLIDLTASVPTPWQAEDENGDPVDQTWQEFFDGNPNRSPLTIGDDTYTSTIVDGDYLSFSEANALGLTLLTQPEIETLQEAEAPA